ncbi:MAG: 3-deoxy-D-manno-octulosonic acid transferase [Rhodobacteraceae bacterium]|nr:3-deoxy-D-manno-octulosonic acid transferase [Paracoccaceae bacterium]
MTGTDTRSNLVNRFGFATAGREGDKIIWLHAASIGELKSVRAFLQFLSAHRTDYRLLVTTNNPTALKLASEWSDLDLVLQTAPLDFTGSVRRFLKFWRPAAFFNVEGELWPNRLTMLSDLKVPVVFINARLSNRSAQRWKVVGLSGKMFGSVTRFFCQNTATAESLKSVGIAPERVETIHNLKSSVEGEVPVAELGRLQAVFIHEKTILAASTHKGEDEVVLAAFARLQKEDGALKLILAPRHPHRGPEIEKLVRKLGLNLAVRSKGQVPVAGTAVYLADSLGDMPLLYSLAAITFVGGSLVPKGGHTPFEPVHFGSAIISGSNVDNFADEFERLEIAGGCCLVDSADKMTKAIQHLLDKSNREESLAQARVALLAVEDLTPLFQAMIEPLGLEGTQHGGD